MKRKTRWQQSSIVVAVFVCWTHIAAAATPPAALVPEYTRVQLPNGLILLLLEHHELPLVHYELVLRSGAIADPAGKEGLADLTLQVMPKGTRKYTAEQLADELDYLGGTLELDAGAESARLSAAFLAKDIDASLVLLAEVLLHPTFPEEELRKLVELRADEIREAKDNPRRVILPYYLGFLFGAHAFARTGFGTEESVPSITPADVEEFYARFVRPNNAILAVAGDFKAAAMRRKIEKALAAWKSLPVELAQIAQPEPRRGRHVLLVDVPDAVQTYFHIGNVGVAKGHADTAVLDVVNTVFGGRFTSWLQNEMRTKAGLTYNAHSRFIERRVPGPFYISSFTQTATTEQAMDMALELLDRLHKQGLNAEELVSAHQYIGGQFPPEYETAGALANAIAELEFYGLDRDYVNQHTTRVERVTLDDARAAVAKYYPKDDVTIVMIGPAKQIGDLARKYGEVVQKSISDPGF